MCNFFSFCSDGNGKYYYFNWKQRQKLLKNNPKNYSVDSHTSIADFYGFEGIKEDKLNKYEYNPLTGDFNKDKISTTDDSRDAEKWVKKLNFKTIIKPLIVKKIINPLMDLPEISKVTKKEIFLLKKWASLRDSLRDSLWDYLWASVRDSVKASVRDSVRASVRSSLRDSLWDTVKASVRDSVWPSLRDSIGAYFSTFFNIKYKFDFSPLNKLWNKGIIPSFDGRVWRLHIGKQARIIFEIYQEDLKNYNGNKLRKEK